jgi:hypothetical protein
MTSHTDQYRALICITTCRRLKYLYRYLPHFARFCADDQRFSLLLSLDGTEPEVLTFCEEWQIPLVYSDEREGVGMSKNRVLEQFSEFDYYFFLEDDVELVEGSVFPAHVEVAQRSGIHHFSLFVRGGVRKPVGESVVDGRHIIHCLYGGADFNFFTGEGLRQVGGWHPCFAEYRRFGHTEHSYRFVRRGLAPAPFNVVDELADACIWHFHPSVTHLTVAFDDDQVAAPERALIDAALEYVPVHTCSPHHFNGASFDAVEQIAAKLDSGERYPLVTGADRRQSWSDYYVWMFGNAEGLGRRGHALAAAFSNWPANPTLRHTIKTELKRLTRR